jgi:hypothetical protein
MLLPPGFIGHPLTLFQIPAYTEGLFPCPSQDYCPYLFVPEEALETMQKLTPHGRIHGVECFGTVYLHRDDVAVIRRRDAQGVIMLAHRASQQQNSVSTRSNTSMCKVL